MEHIINIDNFIDSIESLGESGKESSREDRESSKYGFEKYYTQFSNEFIEKNEANELWYLNSIQKDVQNRIDKLNNEGNIKYSLTWDMVEKKEINFQTYLENTQKRNKLLILNEFNDFLEGKKSNKGGKQNIITLPEMFTDSNKLTSKCKLLERENFITINDNGKILWTGKTIVRSGGQILKGKKLQLAQLSYDLRKYHKQTYNDKEIHFAYTSYFNCTVAESFFKCGTKNRLTNYQRIFSFLN